MCPEQAQGALAAWREFLDTPLDRQLTRCARQPPVVAAMALFREVAERVPAYAAFLRAAGVDPAGVSAEQDFERLPLVTRDNYLDRHPLPALCRDGRLAGCDMVAVSSGSTGMPRFWPRSVADELAIAWRFEQVLHDSFRAHERRTLVVVCFTLGTWVGGMYTAACCRQVAAKGYPVTVVTPGNNKAEILRVVAGLAPEFDQTVLAGYPSFVKDVIDSGRACGLAWQEHGIRLLLAGDVFSEAWRDLVGERTGSTEPLMDSASLYGTADAGVLGVETPLSILVRRFLSGRPDAARDLFGSSRLPTLLQYDPHSRYFEVRDGTLLFTGDNGVPLVRYHISDEGGIVSYARLLAFLKGCDFDPLAELASRGVPAVRDLPFVYVFGRSHFVVSFFGANIYPENVTVGLEQAGVAAWVSGKFVMQVVEDADRDTHLELMVELAPGEVGGSERLARVAESVHRELLRVNSEFAHYVPAAQQTPRVMLCPHGDPEWFPAGVKHRYTRDASPGAGAA